jgi:hypothetical protein
MFGNCITVEQKPDGTIEAQVLHTKPIETMSDIRQLVAVLKGSK